MKAIQISHQQELNVIEMEKPQAPAQGEVLLKLHYVGFCGSDINTFMGRNTMALNPVIPGHEVGAVIEAVGAGVPDNLKPGMVVTCNPYTNCGKCASCRNRRVNACQHNETLGVQHERRLPCCQSCRGNGYRCRDGHWLWHGGYGCYRTFCPAWCYGDCS